MPFTFCFIGPQDIIHFHGSVSGFAAPIQRFSVLCLTFNMLVNKHSDFLALVFFTGVDVIGTLGLSSVTSAGDETISASIIPFLFFWSSYLPAC